MATISSPGIGSGIDVQTIVSQLVELERAPLTQLKKAATSLQTKMSTYGTIKSQVAALGDAAAKLSTNSGWNAVEATSSNPTAVGVTASSGAPATSLTLEVQQLAKAQSTASAAVPAGTLMGTGSMTIELGSWSGATFTAGAGTPVTVTIGAGEDSLSAIAAKINDANGGVSATVLKDASGERLLMRSRDTGLETSFRLTVADDDGNGTDANGLSRLAYAAGNANGMVQTQAGQNALSTINGVAIETASNRLTDTLPGLTIQLSQVTTAPVELDVSIDQEAVSANVKAFVDAYNTLNTTIANATRYDETTKVAGSLQGDATAIGLQSALRGMMRSITSSTPYTRLVDVGIELKTGGALEIKSEKFNAALADLDNLKALFTTVTGDASTEGFGLKVKRFTDGLNATDGLMSTRTAGLQKSISRNTDEQDRVNDRAARAEVRLLAQYNAMDANVAKLNSLSAFVNQQIALWNNS
jgi:flagellar hook-associated protein 2